MLSILVYIGVFRCNHDLYYLPEMNHYKTSAGTRSFYNPNFTNRYIFFIQTRLSPGQYFQFRESKKMRNITDNQNYCLTQKGVSPIIAILRHWKTLMYIYQWFQTSTLVEKTTIFIFLLKYSTRITPKIPLKFSYFSPLKKRKKREEHRHQSGSCPFLFFLFF